MVDHEPRPTTTKDIKLLSNNTNERWWKDPGLRELNFFILMIFLGQIVSGFDESLIGSLLSMGPFYADLGYPDATIVGLLVGMGYGGGVLAAVPASWLCDRYGRKYAMGTGCVLMIVGVAISTAARGASGYGTFIAGRFMLGVAITFELVSGPAWANELAHPRMRGATGSSYNVFWYIGSIGAAWISFGTGHLTTTWAWRIPSMIQALAPILILCVLPWMPESPRFLIARGEIEKARAILCKYHANGDTNDELVAYEMEEISATLSLEAEVNKAGWNVLWDTRANLKRWLIVLSLAPLTTWCGQSVVSYYFSAVLKSVGVTSTEQQTGINGGLQIFNFFCALAGIFCAERFGRRPMWIICFVVMIISNIIMTACSAAYEKNTSSSASYGVIVAMFIVNAGYNLACNPLLYCYPIELLPYYMRTKAMAGQVALGGMCLMVNSFVNSIALAAIGWRYYLFYLGMMIIMLTYIYFVFPETNGLILEEGAILFDGNQAATVLVGITPEKFHVNNAQERGDRPDLSEKKYNNGSEDTIEI